MATVLRRFLVPLAAGTLLLSTLASGSATARPSYDLYEVRGATTAQERTEIIATGAAIDQVGDDSVLVTATPDDAEAISDLGYDVEVLDPPVPFASP